MSIQEKCCGQKTNCGMSVKIKADNMDNTDPKYFSQEYNFVIIPRL